MTVKLLTEHNLEFLGLKGGCTGLSESTLVEMPHCWKSRRSSYNEYPLIQSVIEEQLWRNTQVYCYCLLISSICVTKHCRAITHAPITTIWHDVYPYLELSNSLKGYESNEYH